MKKLVVVLVLVAIMALVAIPAAASPPIAVEAGGKWSYEVETPYEDVRVEGCNTFITMIDNGDFTGSFVGSETERGVVVIHCNGNVSYKGRLTFEGEVDGMEGTLEMRTVGTCHEGDCFADPTWEGTWVILSGTGDLANLRGQGTWFGTAGNFDYDGSYHFDP